VELNWQVRNDPSEGARVIARERIMVWQLTDALQRRDASAASAARGTLRAYVSAQERAGSPWDPGFTFVSAVREGLDAGDLDGAADDLCFWLSVSTGEGAADDYRVQINAKSVISTGAKFLAAPGGTTHPRAPEIRNGCLRVAEGAYAELSRDLQDAITRMARV
jgi:hypothetical protein